MTAHGKGKWNQFIASLKAQPGQRVHAGTNLPYSVITRLRAAGVSYEVTVSESRKDTGKGYDLYDITAWWPDPTTEIDFVLDRLNVARSTYESLKIERAQLDRDINDLMRQRQSLMRKRSELGRKQVTAMKTIDHERALLRKLEQEL